MMSRIKILLLWLLALAIPVQGFAAVSQLACAPTYQTPSTADMHAMVMPGMDQMDHMAPMDHMDHMDHTAMQSASDHHPQDNTHHQSTSCSSCTVCTIGAILPLTLAPLPKLPLPADIHIALPEHGFVGYTPENPERPPSLSL